MRSQQDACTISKRTKQQGMCARLPYFCLTPHRASHQSERWADGGVRDGGATWRGGGSWRGKYLSCALFLRPSAPPYSLPPPPSPFPPTRSIERVVIAMAMVARERCREFLARRFTMRPRFCLILACDGDRVEAGLAAKRALGAHDKRRNRSATQLGSQVEERPLDTIARWPRKRGAMAGGERRRGGRGEGMEGVGGWGVA